MSAPASGILAIALVKLGARVWAIDNDPIAIKVARENLPVNDVAERFVLSGKAETPQAKFPVVVANLTAETILELAGAIERKLRPAVS